MNVPIAYRLIPALPLFFIAAMLILGPLNLLPGTFTTEMPIWAVHLVGLFLLLIGVAIVLPPRWSLIAFCIVFTIAALFGLWLPFSPGELGGTLEIFTPFGFFTRRLGDTATRIWTAAGVVLFAGIVAATLPLAIQEKFGQRKWLSVIHGIGLLLVTPLLLVMVAMVLILLSPVALFRAIQKRFQRQLSP